MNSDEAHELQKKWGDQPCDHPDIIEEVETKAGTDEQWRCVQCGQLVDFDEWRKSHKGPLDPRDLDR
jgi:hypothetical protein